jgi:hypothetical protein
VGHINALDVMKIRKIVAPAFRCIMSPQLLSVRPSHSAGKVISFLFFKQKGGVTLFPFSNPVPCDSITIRLVLMTLIHTTLFRGLTSLPLFSVMIRPLDT